MSKKLTFRCIWKPPKMCDQIPEGERLGRDGWRYGGARPSQANANGVKK